MRTIQTARARGINDILQIPPESARPPSPPISPAGRSVISPFFLRALRGPGDARLRRAPAPAVRVAARPSIISVMVRTYGAPAAARRRKPIRDRQTDVADQGDTPHGPPSIARAGALLAQPILRVPHFLGFWLLLMSRSGGSLLPPPYMAARSRSRYQIHVPPPPHNHCARYTARGGFERRLSIHYSTYWVGFHDWSGGLVGITGIPSTCNSKAGGFCAEYVTSG